MSCLKKISLAVALIAAFSTPSFAFFDGLTSVTNNLIDSTESVTNNTVNNATTTVLSLSSNPGKMADRIGQMADRIGYMGDRIVTTEGIMAGVAHKMMDTAKPAQQVQQQRAWGFAPTAPAPTPVGYQYNANNYGYGYAQPAPAQHVNANPYMPSAAPAHVPAPAYGYPQQGFGHQGYVQPGNERYSASNMIFGMPGGTYTAARNSTSQSTAPATQGYRATSYAAGYGYAQQPVASKVNNNCGYSYGVPVNCR